MLWPRLQKARGPQHASSAKALAQERCDRRHQQRHSLMEAKEHAGDCRSAAVTLGRLREEWNEHRKAEVADRAHGAQEIHFPLRRRCVSYEGGGHTDSRHR